ncbi:sensory box histidine kinase/response regulator [Salipiger mucosus DSM 16094]|uniref:Sensory box histidine kinase/response regulator n=2 Tax=Salipiger mucosus TaxID=263378 RepID=S9SAA6_9RHOB|nr:sensory box histidine kinase/response regulator [Salipiger mucosus DSM 16094]
MLRRLGHVVTEACDGTEGLARACEGRFDLILMDISMPRLDGVETTRRIRAGGGPNAETPIVALTAHALPGDLARFEAAGMTQALTKPVSRAAMAALFEQDPPAATPAQAPVDEVLDRATLEAAAATLGHETFEAIRAQFIEETEAALDRLHEGLAAGLAPEDYAAEIHKLAGSAAVFGAAGLHAALRAQETRAQDGAELRAAHEGLFPVWQSTRAALAAR